MVGDPSTRDPVEPGGQPAPLIAVQAAERREHHVLADVFRVAGAEAGRQTKREDVSAVDVDELPPHPLTAGEAALRECAILEPRSRAPALLVRVRVPCRPVALA